MKTVWKTTVLVEDEVTVVLPPNARPLSCLPGPSGLGVPNVDIWWLVGANTDQQRERRRVVIASTGHSLDGRIDDLEFVGTVPFDTLHFHVFA